MSKARLEFDLSDEDDKAAFGLAVNGKNAFGALFEISQRLRQWSKYREITTEEARLLLDELHTVFYEVLTENRVDLELYN